MKRIRFAHVLAPVFFVLLGEFIVQIVVREDRALGTLGLVDSFVVEVGQIGVSREHLLSFGIAD